MSAYRGAVAALRFRKVRHNAPQAALSASARVQWKFAALLGSKQVSDMYVADFAGITAHESLWQAGKVRTSGSGHQRNQELRAPAPRPGNK